MSTEERAARLREMYATPGTRRATISAGGARILAMLAPYPWEAGHNLITVPGGVRATGRVAITWEPAYDQRIMGQASAPGFPAGDRARIEAAYGRAGRSRLRAGSLLRPRSRRNRRQGR